MNITDYINEKKRLLLICLFGAFFFSILLVLFGLGISELVFIVDLLCNLCEHIPALRLPSLPETDYLPAVTI